LFLDDPVSPGGTVTLEFTLTHPANAPGDATGISFTDDLDAALSGLVATGLPSDGFCGPGSTLRGTSELNFSGGSLGPGSDCTFSVPLQVPADAMVGTHANITSAPVGLVGNQFVQGSETSADLVVFPNQAPIAENDQATTLEDNPVTIDVTANDTDPDGNPLTPSIADPPTNGSATINDNGTPTDPTDDTFNYTPQDDFFGGDSFTYQATDNGGAADNATVTISVLPVNDPPTFSVPSGVTVDEDSGPYSQPLVTNICPGAQNESDQQLTFSIDDLSGGSSGSLFGEPPALSNDGTLSFTPAPDAFGSGTFSVKLTDDGGTDNGGIDQSDPHEFTINVTNVNDPPVANDDFFSTPENTPGLFDVTQNDTDIDGNDLIISDSTPPDNGTVGIDNNGTPTDPTDDIIRYTPDTNFSGDDTFTYTIDDSHGGTDRATVTVDVTGVNSPPVAQDDMATTLEDTPTGIDVLGNDTDGDGDDLTLGPGAPPGNGTFEINDNGTPNDPTDDTITYTPTQDYFGLDTFTYTIDDGLGGSDAATVSITVQSVNDPPVPGNVTHPQDGSHIIFGGDQGMAPGDPGGDFTIDFTAPSDVENDPLTNTVQLGTTSDFNGSSVLLFDVNVGTATQYQTTVGELATQLTNNGVDLFGSIDAYLRVVTSDGTDESASPTVTLELTRGTLSDVASDQELPDTYELLQNYPNPFNPETTIEYRLPEVNHVQIEVVDLQGRRVALLVDRIQPAGRHQVSFNAEDLPSGIYLYQMRAGDFSDVKELILLK